MPDERKADVPLHDTTTATIAVLLCTHLERARPHNIKPDSNLRDDFGADSLDLWTIVVALEMEFKIHIPDDMGRKLSTVKDIYHCVNLLKGMQ